jgi:UDP-arabinose 4-epimerase
LRSNRILVTGGAGYVGSHTCKRLAAAGYEPVAYDNLEKGHRWAVKWGPLVDGDIADSARLRETLARYEISAVMHFAAHAYVGESVANPRKYFYNNVAGTLNVLNCMLDYGLEAFVFSSTCATYGEPARLPIDEDHPQNPVNPYGASKLMVETVLRSYESAYGMRYASLRYFNAAGADEEGEIGEDHDPETHLIPLVIAAAQGKVDHVAIFGTDYETPDGTPIRDYVHVSDLADAHVRALNTLLDGGSSGVYNLGSGTGSSVRDVVGTVEAVSGRKVPVIEAPRRPGDVPILVASADLANVTLGWQVRRSDLRQIIETAWNWHEGRAFGRPEERCPTT